jgi:hypothetical protein
MARGLLLMCSPLIPEDRGLNPEHEAQVLSITCSNGACLIKIRKKSAKPTTAA